MVSDGWTLPNPVFIYVDDLLISEVVSQMERALLAFLEATFVVMGRPDEGIRQCTLALDKWMDLKVGHKFTLLGLCLNSRNLNI